MLSLAGNLMNEGVVKYRCNWTYTEPVAVENIVDLMEWRDRLHAWGLIGVYENGIGFGNVSIKLGNDGEFMISGTQTAHLPSLGPEFCCNVTEFNLEENSIACSGPVQPSSESLTHAALYLHSGNINAIANGFDTKTVKLPSASCLYGKGKIF